VIKKKTCQIFKIWQVYTVDKKRPQRFFSNL
jgi:hypothetical protein